MKRWVVAVVLASLALGTAGIWRGVERRRRRPAPRPALTCKDYTITGSAYWKDFCPPIKYTMDFTMIGDEAVIKCRCKP